MSTHGDGHGGPDAQPRPTRRSRLADLAAAPDVPTVTQQAHTSNPQPRQPTATAAVTAPQELAPDQATAARREFMTLLGEFRRTAVLVPLAPDGGIWTAEQGGVRWICAFSHEEALARFAHTRGEASRAWEYRTVLGARLLDVMVPLLGGPAGVALDAGSDDGTLFPPVEGVVPMAAAVDLGDTE
ncbi:SseB family protein [Streptomyces sp. TRM49041]|uniref:SseB family protein n=1 Tax=Streptomyces sp. TRM49041 TaxID=2603216 RepID=UPI0011EC4A5C